MDTIMKKYCHKKLLITSLLLWAKNRYDHMKCEQQIDYKMGYETFSMFFSENKTAYCTPFWKKY